MLKFSTDNRQAEDMAGGKDHRVMLSFMLIEQKDFIEKWCLGGGRKVREHVACSLGFYSDG